MNQKESKEEPQNYTSMEVKDVEPQKDETKEEDLDEDLDDDSQYYSDEDYICPSCGIHHRHSDEDDSDDVSHEDQLLGTFTITSRHTISNEHYIRCFNNGDKKDAYLIETETMPNENFDKLTLTIKEMGIVDECDNPVRILCGAFSMYNKFGVHVIDPIFDAVRRETNQINKEHKEEVDKLKSELDFLRSTLAHCEAYAMLSDEAKL